MAHRDICTVKKRVDAAGRHVWRLKRFHTGIEAGDENYIAESTGNTEARSLRNLVQGPVEVNAKQRDEKSDTFRPTFFTSRQIAHEKMKKR